VGFGQGEFQETHLQLAEKRAWVWESAPKELKRLRKKSNSRPLHESNGAGAEEVAEKLRRPSKTSLSG
jgi:hypothetical protein